MQTADVKTSAIALRIEAGQSVVLQLCHAVARIADNIQSVQETDADTTPPKVLQYSRPRSMPFKAGLSQLTQ